MKRALFIIIALSVLCSCRDNSPLLDREAASFIGSSTYQAMATEENGTGSATTLADNTQALFNATGGLILTNRIMTYSNGQWNTNPQLEWNESTDSTRLTALYPVFDGFTYTTDKLYDGSGMLTDVLCAQTTVEAREEIQLQFNHLFSMITFRLSTRLQQKFKSIALSYPRTVTSIDPPTAAITLSTDTVHAITQTATADGRYSFIVPAAENVAIRLTVETTDKAYPTKEIPACTFAQGYETVYRVDSDEKMPGISTVEQFIKFTQLINTKEAELNEADRTTLESFRVKTENETIYYLLNDLDFKNAKPTDIGLEQIGYYLSTKPSARFNATFDGQGYTISHITPASGYGTTALFGTIGSSGIVRNLHIDSCNITTEDDNGSTSGAAALVGINYGIITNCSVTNSTISFKEQSTPVGGLVGNLRGGTINNSYVKETTLTASEYSGGIVGNSYGNIINCYSSSNTLNANNCGGISGMSNLSKPTHIKNSYVYNLKFEKGTKGLFYGNTTNNKSSIAHCFFYNSKIALAGSKYVTMTDTMKISELETPLHQKLNEWIEANQASYPNLTFTQWKEGTSPTPAIFIQ